jgi:zinc protease
MLKRLLSVFILPFVLATAFSAARPFPQQDSDLHPDPAARFGTLPNGLRYVVYPNHEPRGRISLRLLVSAGSFNETDDQRGLAHFLEHMAFNGSTHYAPGTLVEFFQRMGMSFGGDSNASTSFDRTLYQLELPNTKTATIDEGLRVLSDFAGGLLLEPAQIDKERGIILSEKRTRDSVGYRTFVAQFDFLLPHTLPPQRLPIGLTNIIEHAARPQFETFYNTWYRPQLMSVVAVGDADPALIEKQIVAAFSGVTDRAPARPEPDLGRLAPVTGVHVLYHAEAEAPGTSVSIDTVVPYAHEPDTAALHLRRLPRDLATAIVNRRLAILAKKEGAPFSDGSLGVEEVFDFFRQTSIDLNCKAGQWSAALGVADQELRRALKYGFEPGELKEVVSDYLNGLEQAVKTAATRHSDALANEIADSLQQRQVFTSPAADLALLKPALEKVTPAECLAALRDAWAAPHRYVIVTGNAKIAGDAPAAIAAAYARSHAVAVPPPARRAELAWAYTNFGAPGKVVRRKHIADLDLDQIVFANGVRLNLKKTPFEAGVIRLATRVGTGLLTEPPDERGLSALAGGTFDAGGLGRHSVDDLTRILAGKTVGVGFSAETDTFAFSGTTSPDDLTLELQLLAAKIVDPGYRPEALRQARKGIDQMYLGFAHTLNGPLATQVAHLVAGGDPRFGLPPKDILLARTLDEERAWLTPQLTHGAIELSLVGDLDIDATIAAVAQTLGALPPRDPKPALDALRHVAFPARPFAKEYSIASEIPKGLVVVYWPTTDESDIHRTRRLNLLASVLSDRLRVKIREELGGAYSPDARSFTSDTFPGYGYLTATVIVAPGMADKIADTVMALGDELAVKGVTADELDRAKQPILTAIKETARNNRYWLGAVLTRSQEKPEVLDWARSRTSDFESITADELTALAKTYLSRSRASRVVVLPSSPPKPAAGSTAPTAPVPSPAPGK